LVDWRKEIQNEKSRIDFGRRIDSGKLVTGGIANCPKSNSQPFREAFIQYQDNRQHDRSTEPEREAHYKIENNRE
jgi:hypothetical protein